MLCVDTRATAAQVGILVYIVIQDMIAHIPSGNLQIVDNLHAETDEEFLTGDSTQAWDGDHIMELQIITNFFASDQGAQWQYILDEMLNVSGESTDKSLMCW